ncbi:MAG: hypothetical protein ACQEXX_30940 [Bacillota bacterium]
MLFIQQIPGGTLLVPSENDSLSVNHEVGGALKKIGKNSPSSVTGSGSVPGSVTLIFTVDVTIPPRSSSMKSGSGSYFHVPSGFNVTVRTADGFLSNKLSVRHGPIVQASLSILYANEARP